MFQTASALPPGSHALSPEVLGGMWVIRGCRAKAARVTGKSQSERPSVPLNQGLSRSAGASLGLQSRLPAGPGLGSLDQG